MVLVSIDGITRCEKCGSSEARGDDISRTLAEVRVLRRYRDVPKALQDSLGSWLYREPARGVIREMMTHEG